MPTLNWIGKDTVVEYHKEVPYHLLRCNPDLSIGEAGSGNLLVQGDNLLALKALLPYYAGKVKCIYIDPPYNTGEENWVYNDNVNSPEIKAWLGKVVGKEAEDLSRHDKWLCMMYPRLSILKEFLSVDGVIFVSIDDNEISSLRKVMDEIWGAQCFIAQIVWQKRTSPESRLLLGSAHDYIVAYARTPEGKKTALRKIPLSGSRANDYKNPDNDPRGPWASVDLTGQTGHATPDQFYVITTPTGIKYSPPTGRCWAIAESTFNNLIADKRVWFGIDGSSRPRRKNFLFESEGMTTWTWWPNKEVGHNQEATKEIGEILGNPDAFETPKPTRLIKRLLQLATDADSLILDSFAGSGTTGQAVMEMNNEEDGSSRNFILIEFDKDIANNVTAQRLSRVINGYSYTGVERQLLLEEKITVTNFKKSETIMKKVEKIKIEQTDKYSAFETKIEVRSNAFIAFYGKNQIEVTKPGLGGGFRFCDLGDTLFDARGQIRPDVTFGELAQHIFFTETGEPLPTSSGSSPLLGVVQGVAVYLLYNGILGDKSEIGGNILTRAIFANLPPHDGPKVIYGHGSLLSRTSLQQHQIRFCQIPYEVKVS